MYITDRCANYVPCPTASDLIDSLLQFCICSYSFLPYKFVLFQLLLWTGYYIYLVPLYHVNKINSLTHVLYLYETQFFVWKICIRRFNLGRSVNLAAGVLGCNSNLFLSLDQEIDLSASFPAPNFCDFRGEFSFPTDPLWTECSLSCPFIPKRNPLFWEFQGVFIVYNNEKNTGGEMADQSFKADQTRKKSFLVFISM